MSDSELELVDSPWTMFSVSASVKTASCDVPPVAPHTSCTKPTVSPPLTQCSVDSSSHALHQSHTFSRVCVVCVLQRHLTVRVLFFLPYLHSLVLNVAFWFFSYLLFFVFFSPSSADSLSC